MIKLIVLTNMKSVPHKLRSRQYDVMDLHLSTQHRTYHTTYGPQQSKFLQREHLPYLPLELL